MHRIDLRSGERSSLDRDDRPRLRVLDDRGQLFSALGLTDDGDAVLVARTLGDGPRAWVGWYDTANGTLRGERSWPLREQASSIRLAGIAPDVFALIAFEGREDRVTAQQLHILDGSGREIASLDASQLPATAPCSPDFVALGPDRWGTVCSWRTGDLARRSPSIIGVDSLDPRLAGATVRSFVRLGEGRIALAWVAGADRTATGGVAVVDGPTGGVRASAAIAGPVLDLGAAAQRLYVLHGAGASQLRRLDAATLTPLGPAVAVARHDDIDAGGIGVVAPP